MPGRLVQHQEEQGDFLLSAPAVSLPRGGGAIRAIDGTFSANPSRGTATFELPTQPWHAIRL